MELNQKINITETKRQLSELLPSLEAGNQMLTFDSIRLAKTCLVLIAERESLSEKIISEVQRDRVIDEVRSFLIDLHRGNRDLGEQLKALNSSMLFLEGRDYIENGPTPKLS